MRLAKLSDFRRLVYMASSAPSMQTLRKRIDKNMIAGGTIQDGHYYVDMDEFDRVHSLRTRLADQEAELAKGPTLERSDLGKQPLRDWPNS